MRIAAIRIAQWADSPDARGQLPVLVRRLIVATANLSELSVRGADTNNLPGWDGTICATAGNAWVSVGSSRWEMGCSEDAAAKAREDFRTRTEQTPAVVARNLDFVFVTPRIWSRKNDWREEAQELGHWRSVRAYDADDLEAWLEVAGSVRLWFAELLGLHGPGVCTVTAFWDAWRQQTRPEITASALATGRTLAVEQFARDLAGATAIISLEADSIEEAVAFGCAQLDALGLTGSAICVTEVDGWRYADANPDVRIAVAANPLVAAARAPRDGTTLVLPQAMGNRPRSEIPVHSPGTARIELARADVHDFEQALIAMGEEPADAARRALRCGRSWSVYRRLRAVNRAISAPGWMSDPAAACLTTIVLVGAWNGRRSGDTACIEAITGRRYEDVERELLQLVPLDDSPVLKLGDVWKAKAPLELLYLFAPKLTTDEVSRFLAMAEAILTKPDPMLELEPDKRWMASVYGKVREESGIVLGSIVESLAKLSVYAEHVADHTLLSGIDRLIERLLHGAPGPRWMSLAGVLRELAEASPDVFLRAVDASLRRDDVPIRALFGEGSGDTMFERDFHTHLLWALEILAWSPKHLGRVCDALARLMEFPVRQNLTNRPSNSLCSLLRPWWPQTTARAETRLAVFDRLIRDHSVAAWEVLIHCIPGQIFVSANAKPQWRDDDAGAPGVNHFDEYYFSEVGARVLAQARDHAARIATLVSKIDAFEGDYRAQVLGLLRGAVKLPDAERQLVRDALRERLNLQLSFNRENADAMTEAQSLRTLFDALAPDDLPTRHAWLFAGEWVELPDGREGDYHQAERDRERLRVAALEEIFNAGGWLGVERLIELASGPGLVGWYLNSIAAAGPDLSAWVLRNLSARGCPPHDPVLRGLLHGMPPEQRTSFINELAQTDNDARRLAVLTAAPIERQTWNLVEGLTLEAQDAYWRAIRPGIVTQDGPDLDFIIDRLMGVGRPLSAFRVLQYRAEAVDSARLIAVLNALSQIEEPDAGPLDGARIAGALRVLANDARVPRREVAVLEFRFLNSLETRTKGARTLHSEMLQDADFFMELACIAFTPRDVEDDRVQIHQSVRSHAWSVMHNGRGVPGLADGDVVDAVRFTAWIDRVRTRARETHRAPPVDSTIGTWLSRCPADSDGLWPCLPVRELLEDPGAESIRNGFVTGVLNNRGVHSRAMGEGGNQERDLAAHYRAAAQTVAGGFPMTAATLEGIARSYDHDAKRHDDDAALMREHP